MNSKISRNIVSFLLLAGLSMAFFACEEPEVADKGGGLTPATAVTGVTVSPATASVAKGATQPFTAKVNGTNNPAQTVTWTIVETGKNSGTTISTSGLLTIAAAETLTTLTVKATSTADTAKFGTATVTVPTGASTALTGTVSITGTQRVLETLTANTSSLNGSGTIIYQWARGNMSSGSFSNISGATSATYTLTMADLTKYIRVTVSRSGNSGSVNSSAVQVQQATDPTLALTSANNASSIVTEGSRTDIVKIDVSKLGTNWSAVQYSLAAYKGKEIVITLSVEVKREGAAGNLNWQINNNPGFPSVASLDNAAVNIWHTMTGEWTGIPSDANPALYLNHGSSSTATAYYIDNLVLTINERDPFSGETLNTSSQEQVTRIINGYDYELWNQDKKGTATMTVPGEGSNANGGIYKCEWNGINNALFRAGKKYNETQTHKEIGSISIEYEAKEFNILGGDVTYLSVYGWVSGGASGTTSENLVEYYIVDNYGSYNPGSGGTSKGTVTIDGASYTLYVKTINGPSIKNGITTFTQYLSVRAAGSKRKSGTIDVTKHFEAWEAAGMTKIATGKFYEVAFKVEAYSGAPDYKAKGNAEITKNILSIKGVPIQ